MREMRRTNVRKKCDVRKSQCRISLTNPFLNGKFSSNPISQISKSISSLSSPPSSKPFTFLPTIKAMKTLRGRVTCATSDKTVAVEVTRLAPHPKYKRRIRYKKKYQAHDPENQFKVGDFVQLEKCGPISKLKTFLAVPAPQRNVRKVADGVAAELGIELESSQAAA